MTEVSHRKIVIAVNEISTGGLGSYLVTLAMGLRTRGWSVHMLVTNVRGDLFEYVKGFIPCRDLSELPLSAGKIINAASIVNKVQPDILLMNNCSLMHYALPLVLPHTKPVAVLHSDDDRFYKTASLFGKRIFRWIAPSQGVAERFKTFLQQEQRGKLRLIPHGIDNRMFTMGKDRGQRITKNICFVGYLAENKGADLLPDIFLRISLACPDVRFTIVGHGPLEQTVRRRCEETGLLDKCTWTGAIDHARVAEILRDSDILLLPTRIEGFGLSIVEAMMSGAVPVVSRLKGITEDIVDDSRTGLLIEPDNIAGFADATATLLNNPHMLARMSEAAQKTAVDRFVADTMTNAYELLFNEADSAKKRTQRTKAGWISEVVPEVLKNGRYMNSLRKITYLIR